MVIAAFDLDDTLLDGDSDTSWRSFLVEEGILDPELEARSTAQFLKDYLQGQLDVAACSRFAVAPLVGMEPAALAELQRRFCERHVEPMVRQPALDLVDEHRQRGDELVIITSTCRLVASVANELFGIAELLATELEWKDGRLTGAVCDVPCYRDGKKVRLERWAAERGLSLDGAFFYSDSKNDLPLLEAVENPVAVNPDPELRAHAERHGWPILQLHPPRQPP